MKVFSVGPDDFDEWDLKQVGDDFDWFVYWYEEGDYDGSGYAVGLKDGLLHTINLGHCSCYGPLENTWEVQTVEKFFEHKVSIHDWEHRKEVTDKVREILG